jgi:hypothetical protein
MNYDTQVFQIPFHQFFLQKLCTYFSSLKKHWFKAEILQVVYETSQYFLGGRVISVCIATGYGLKDREVGVSVPVAIRTPPTAAIEVLFGLPPLHLQLEAEARAGIYRLYCSEQWKPKSIGFDTRTRGRTWRKKPISQMRTDKMIPRHVYCKAFTVRFPDRIEWKDGFQPDRKGGLI